ncbi:MULTISPECIES: FeoC-like transcriptional regulator [Streptomyces]|nr:MULTISPECIES: FeoC-like transcriptional regulator [Streptomyces]KNE82041.1 hypothetical protein ADZ36_12745 [Streptomyces fradiae]OFA49568.1 hypothetical protein BEN35_17510 [Streptomyces fradiae]PQM21681.1 hypothetical protein Sfr7A_18700 [Streptomyces xinghaiensis]
MSPLRRVLTAVTEGRARTLDDVAREAGVSRDEASAMLDYWVSRGRLTREEITPGCPPRGCGSCPMASGCTTRTPGSAPALITIGVRPRRS